MVLSPTHLKCEYKVNPIGVDARRPRLSWQIQSQGRGVMQTAYQVRVTGQDGEVLWDSGRVDSDQSIHVAYCGPELQSGQRCAWQVRAWIDDLQATEWSESATCR